jgi:hypothetical protein
MIIYIERKYQLDKTKEKEKHGLTKTGSIFNMHRSVKMLKTMLATKV